MKKFSIFLAAAAMLASSGMRAAEKEDIVKTGFNFGPLPAIAFDADKGFQYGAILQIYYYGDGHNYPNYDNKTYLEYSRFTKGSQLIQVQHDNKELIPGVRWSSALRINLDKAFDFYGLNGYQSYYNYDLIEKGKAGEMFSFNPFYKMKRNEFILRSDFLGVITPELKWEAGLFARYYDIGSIDYESINKGKDEGAKYPTIMPTLYDIYRKSGVLSEEEADGGLASGIRLGMVYDTRDKEGAPTEGIWAEGHVIAALPGISKIPYYKYSLTWRQYFPLIKNDILTFAYRLNYEGTFGDAPFYALPFLTSMGEANDRDGMGGYGTVRGVMRTRIVGLDMATYTAELRWRFTRFHLFNQNIAFGLSAFSDGSMVTRGRDLGVLSQLGSLIPSGYSSLATVNNEIEKDRFHISAGAGLRFIMNENFIVAFEYGTPLSHFMKSSPIYNQDGNGAFYINLGYVF